MKVSGFPGAAGRGGERIPDSDPTGPSSTPSSPSAGPPTPATMHVKLDMQKPQPGVRTQSYGSWSAQWVSNSGDGIEG